MPDDGSGDGGDVATINQPDPGTTDGSADTATDADAGTTSVADASGDVSTTDGSADPSSFGGSADAGTTDTSTDDSTDTGTADAGTADASTDASTDGSADTTMGDTSTDGSADTTTADAGTADGSADASTADAGTADGSADAGTGDGSTDTGTVDGGIADAGTVAGAPDGSADASTSDAGTTDGSADAGTADAGTADAGTADAGIADAGTTDAGTTDAGTADAGTTDAGTTDAGTADAGTTPAPTTPPWLTTLPAAPNAPAGQGALTFIPVPSVPMGTAADITLQYATGVPAVAPSATAATQTICTAIDDARNQVGIVTGLHAVPLAPQPGNPSYTMRGYQYVSPTRVPLRTSLTAAQALAAANIASGSGVSDADIFQAQQDLWHDLSGIEGDPAAINAYDSVNVTWGGGFAAAGHLQALLTTLFARSSDARQLFQSTGMWVRNGEFLAVDTTRQWVLSGEDAERYIRCDRRLLSLFIRIGSGTVPATLLPTNTAAANAALVTASLDAQFIELIRPGSAGNFGAWAVPSPWTRQLRAGIAHNMHWGIVPSNWGPYRATNADPARVIRVMTWSVAQSLVASFEGQGTQRFAGTFGHGAFTAALAGFSQASPSDPPNSRYINVNNRRLLVPQP